MRLPWVALLGVGFGIAAALELFAALRPPLAEATADEVAQAAARVEAERAPGDVVMHSPLLSPAALTGLGDMPASFHFPPQRLRNQALWLVDRTGWPTRLPRGYRGTEVARFGAVTVRRAEPPAGSAGDGPLFDLLRDLEPGMMRVERPLGTVVSECRAPRSDEGFGCAGQKEWIYAAPHQQVIAGATKSCVWAHPITDATVVFQLPPPPEVGKKLELTVGAGLADSAVQMADGRPVQTVIAASGRAARTLTVPNRPGWFEQTLEVKPGAPIELRITTPFDGMRHHCINATLRVVEAEGAPE